MNTGVDGHLKIGRFPVVLRTGHETVLAGRHKGTVHDGDLTTLGKRVDAARSRLRPALARNPLTELGSIGCTPPIEQFALFVLKVGTDSTFEC
jgi:hypothetical protein